MDELFAISGAGEFGIIREQFAAILGEIASKFLSDGASQLETRELFGSLKLKELVLARACAAGNERAWETFLVRYREKLYDMAAGIARESSVARELADEMYADLYGTATRDGERVSKLSSYSGRGSLEGWLRTVMAQAFVNRYRRQRRLVSLDEESEGGAQFAARETEAVVVADGRVQAATDEALGTLSSEDRYLLASYYLDERTLAQIARTLSVHESTVSRKLDKLAKSLRKQILSGLGRRGMSRAQAEEALELDVRDLSLNIRARLTQKDDIRAFPDKKAQAGAGEGSD
jgi:RNA polymerase sigma-70 factor, ECF subfamily